MKIEKASEQWELNNHKATRHTDVKESITTITKYIIYIEMKKWKIYHLKYLFMYYCCIIFYQMSDQNFN